MAEVGSAYVSILPSAKGFGRKLEGDVSGEVRGAGKSMGSTFGKAFKVGAVALLAGAALTGKFLKGAIEEAREAQVVTARTENVIRKMGDGAGYTAERIGLLSSALSLKTGIDDEAIQSGANLLLTFGKIRNEAGEGNNIFARTTELMVDMSAAMGTDAKGSAIQLGKALNDPLKGLTALSRVGVSFSESQKKAIETMVESGNVLGAQKIILGELDKQFGGAAEAMATPAMKASVAWANFKEEIGTRLLPIVDKVLNKFTDFLPTLMGWVDQLGPIFRGVVDAIRPVISTIRDALQPVLDKVGGWIKDNPRFVKAFAIALGVLVVGITAVTIATGLFSIALNSTGIPLVIIAIAALVAGLVIAYQKSETFRSIVQSMGDGIRSFATFVRDEVVPVVVNLARKVGEHLAPVFDQLGKTFKKDILPTVQKVIAKFREWQPTIQRVIGAVVKVIAKVVEFAAKILGVVLPPMIRFVGFIFSRVVPALLAQTEGAARFIGKLIELGKTVVDRIKDFAKFLVGVKEKMGQAIDFVKSLPGRLANSLGSLATTFLNKGKELIQGLIDGITDKIQAVKDKMSEVADAIGGFLPGSPVKEGPLKSWNNGGAGKKLMEFLAKGIADNEDTPAEAMNKAVEKIRKALEAQLDKLRSSLSNLRSDFESIASSVAGAFTGNLFEAEDSGSFIDNLLDTRGQLRELKAAFKKLVGFGLKPEFLSQLFGSGNGGLILDLAAGTKAEARSGAALFGQVTSLSNSLGNAVAKNDLGPEIRNVANRIDKLGDKLDKLPKDIGREINHASSRGRRNAGRAA